MQDFLKTLSDIRGITTVDNDHRISICCLEKCIAELTLSPPVIFFRLKPDFTDHLNLLSDTVEPGMFCQISLDSGKNRRYCLMILTSFIKTIPASEDDPVNDLKQLVSVVMADLQITPEEWKTLDDFSSCCNIPSAEQIIISALFEVLKSHFLKNRLIIMTESGSRTLFSAENTKENFCVLDTAEGGSIFFYLPDQTAPEQFALSAKPHWFRLNPVKGKTDFTKIPDLFRFSLNAAVHRFLSQHKER